MSTVIGLCSCGGPVGCGVRARGSDQSRRSRRGPAPKMSLDGVPERYCGSVSSQRSSSEASRAALRSGSSTRTTHRARRRSAALRRSHPVPDSCNVMSGVARRPDRAIAHHATNSARSWVPVPRGGPSTRGSGTSPCSGVSNCTTHMPSAPCRRARRARHRHGARSRRRSPHHGAPRPGTPRPLLLRRVAHVCAVRRGHAVGNDPQAVQPHHVVEPKHAANRECAARQARRCACPLRRAAWDASGRSPQSARREEARAARRRTHRARRARIALDVEAVADGCRSGNPGTAPDRARRSAREVLELLLALPLQRTRDTAPPRRFHLRPGCGTRRIASRPAGRRSIGAGRIVPAARACSSTRRADGRRARGQSMNSPGPARRAQPEDRSGIEIGLVPEAAAKRRVGLGSHGSAPRPMNVESSGSVPTIVAPCGAAQSANRGNVPRSPDAGSRSSWSAYSGANTPQRRRAANGVGERSAASTVAYGSLRRGRRTRSAPYGRGTAATTVTATTPFPASAPRRHDRPCDSSSIVSPVSSSTVTVDASSSDAAAPYSVSSRRRRPTRPHGLDTGSRHAAAADGRVRRRHPRDEQRRAQGARHSAKSVSVRHGCERSVWRRARRARCRTRRPAPAACHGHRGLRVPTLGRSTSGTAIPRIGIPTQSGRWSSSYWTS